MNYKIILIILLTFFLLLTPCFALCDADYQFFQKVHEVKKYYD